MTYGERLLSISTLSSGTASELIQNIVTGEVQPTSGTIEVEIQSIGNTAVNIAEIEYISVEVSDIENIAVIIEEIENIVV